MAKKGTHWRKMGTQWPGYLLRYTDFMLPRPPRSNSAVPYAEHSTLGWPCKTVSREDVDVSTTIVSESGGQGMMSNSPQCSNNPSVTGYGQGAATPQNAKRRQVNCSTQNTACRNKDNAGKVGYDIVSKSIIYTLL